MADNRGRRIRRAWKARMKFGKTAAARHALLHGRTGSFWKRLTPSRRMFAYSSRQDSIRLPSIWNVG